MRPSPSWTEFDRANGILLDSPDHILRNPVVIGRPKRRLGDTRAASNVTEMTGEASRSCSPTGSRPSAVVVLIERAKDARACLPHILLYITNGARKTTRVRNPITWTDRSDSSTARHLAVPVVEDLIAS